MQLDDVEAEKLLEHLFWDCITADKFRQRCAFIFNGPMILLVWKENERSVTIAANGNRKITASV